MLKVGRLSPAFRSASLFLKVFLDYLRQAPPGLPSSRRPPVLMRRFKQCESLVFVVLPECVPGFAAPPPKLREVRTAGLRDFCRSNPKICGKSVDKILFQLYNEYKEGKTANGYAKIRVCKIAPIISSEGAILRLS